jgi:ferredoxin-NADP reductase
MAKLTARLAKREKIADSTYAFTLEPREAPFAYRAGQTIDLTLPRMSHPDPAGNKRTFSIANAPGYGGFLIATRVRGGGLKLGLVEAPLGSDLEVEGPYGNFTLPNKPSDVVMLAGGIGITPFRAMVEDALERSLDHTLSLIHSSRTPEEAPFLEELIRWGIKSAEEMTTQERRGGFRSSRKEPAIPPASPTAGAPQAPPEVSTTLGESIIPRRAQGEPGVSGSPIHPGLSGSHFSEAAHGVPPSETPSLGESPSGPSTLAVPWRPRFVYIPTMTQPGHSARGWKGESRRVSPEFLADVLPASRNEPLYYVAGPARFVHGAVESLKSAGVDEDRIRFEEFLGY